MKILYIPPEELTPDIDDLYWGLKKLDDVQLRGVKRQRLDLDDAVVHAPVTSVALRAVQREAKSSEFDGATGATHAQSPWAAT